MCNIKLLGRKQENLQDLWLGKEFLVLKAQLIKVKIDNWTLMRIKNVLSKFMEKNEKTSYILT